MIRNESEHRAMWFACQPTTVSVNHCISIPPYLDQLATVLGPISLHFRIFWLPISSGSFRWIYTLKLVLWVGSQNYIHKTHTIHLFYVLCMMSTLLRSMLNVRHNSIHEYVCQSMLAPICSLLALAIEHYMSSKRCVLNKYRTGRF